MIRQTEFSRSVLVHLEAAEEGGGMLQFALDVEGDHPGAACALSLHQLMLRVGRQACEEPTDPLSLLTPLQSTDTNFSFFSFFFLQTALYDLKLQGYGFNHTGFYMFAYKLVLIVCYFKELRVTS